MNDLVEVVSLHIGRSLYNKNITTSNIVATNCYGEWMGYRVKRHFQQYISYIVTVNFIGGGNRSTRENHRTATSH